MNTYDKLIKFRNTIYEKIKYRRDATMELIDAVSSFGHQCKSIVELSEAPCFTRKYSSVTDAIADGSADKDIEKIREVIIEQTVTATTNRVIFGMDVTSHSRQHAEKLEDRSFVNAPNYTPGQKPITVGHSYALLAQLPQQEKDKQNHWINPISIIRVKSSEKGTEVGMRQLHDAISSLKTKNVDLVVNVSDTAYGAKSCLKSASMDGDLIHIYRLANNRNIYFSPKKTDVKQKKYGDKMKLNAHTTYQEPDEKTEFCLLKKKKDCFFKIKVERWNNMLFRGDRNFKGSEHPIDLIKITKVKIDKNGNEKIISKRPMWLSMFGKKRAEISMHDAYEYYRQRFDLEHFFRFGKNKLLINKYQTPDVNNEETLWNIISISYIQLYLARHNDELHLRPWEKYLNKGNTEDGVLTPTQTQRGFSNVIEQIKSPALPAKPRGKSLGRKDGEVVKKRENQIITIKPKKPQSTRPQIKLSGFVNTEEILNPESLSDAIKTIPEQLKKIGFTLEQFQKAVEKLKVAA
tara:strand:- start:100 stop:1656 length:1557 start_codon:yes stop_codon:yes gene_type:complete